MTNLSYTPGVIPAPSWNNPIFKFPQVLCYQSSVKWCIDVFLFLNIFLCDTLNFLKHMETNEKKYKVLELFPTKIYIYESNKSKWWKIPGGKTAWIIPKVRHNQIKNKKVIYQVNYHESRTVSLHQGVKSCGKLHR